MAFTGGGGGQNFHLHHYSQPHYIDSLLFLPTSSFHNHLSTTLLASLHDFHSDSSFLSFFSLQHQPTSSSPPPPSLTLLSSSPSPSSRLSHLRLSPSNSLLAASSSSSLHFFALDPANSSIDDPLSVDGRLLHSGGSARIDLEESTGECVSVGEDGRVNSVLVSQGGRVDWKKVYDSGGLAAYTAVRWASPVEFVTGSPGFGIQCWDRRKPDGPTMQLPGKWASGKSTGIVHSIDIHPSRKHICVAGASSGTVFAWDLRQPLQPISLCGIGPNRTSSLLSDGEVWEVRYDYLMQSATSTTSSSPIPPVMMCSEDGLAAIVEAGKPPLELLAEPCAINSFAINPNNPSEVVFGLEWETLAVLTRS